MMSVSRRAAIPWPALVGCACAGVLTGILLRFGVDAGRPKSPPLKTAKPRTRNSSAAPLPSSLKAIETELQLTLAAGRQAEEDAAAWEQWLEAFAQRLAPGDFADAARRGLELPAKIRRGFLLSVIRRWAERNGAEAIAFAESRAPEELRQTMVEEALDHWSTADSSGALRWIMQRSEGGQRSERLQRFIRAVEWSNPAAALAALENLPRSFDNETTRQQLARRLAEHDLPAAMTALLHGQQDNDATRKAAEDLAALWLDQDPAGAMAWATHLRNAEERRVFEQHLASAWVRKDVQAALQWVNSQPAWKRASLLGGLFEQWSKQDPNAAKEYALTLHGEDRTFGVSNVVFQLALHHNDLRGALELHNQLGSSEENRRAQLFRDLVRNANRDYREGVEILRDLPANEENQRLLDRYIARWLWDDEAAAGQFLKENDLADKLPGAVLNRALQLARNTGEEALKWARDLPPGASRDNALYAVVCGLAEKNPENAAQLLMWEVPAQLQPDAARRVAEQWYGKDPARATAWAQSLANESSRTLACAALVESWSSKDPTGPVVQWVESLPPGPTYDVAVAKYAKNVASTDPEAALAWVATISDPQLRQLQMEDRAKAWLQNNRADATLWIEQTGTLSPEAKQRLLSGDTH